MLEHYLFVWIYLIGIVNTFYLFFVLNFPNKKSWSYLLFIGLWSVAWVFLPLMFVIETVKLLMADNFVAKLEKKVDAMSKNQKV